MRALHPGTCSEGLGCFLAAVVMSHTGPPLRRPCCPCTIASQRPLRPAPPVPTTTTNQRCPARPHHEPSHLLSPFTLSRLPLQSLLSLSELSPVMTAIPSFETCCFLRRSWHDHFRRREFNPLACASFRHDKSCQPQLLKCLFTFSFFPLWPVVLLSSLGRWICKPLC